jgi:hypothetical protein
MNARVVHRLRRLIVGILAVGILTAIFLVSSDRPAVLSLLSTTTSESRGIVTSAVSTSTPMPEKTQELATRSTQPTDMPYPGLPLMVPPTPSPDPTRLALTTDEFAALHVAEMETAWNPLSSGPYKVLVTADVYPGDIPRVVNPSLVQMGVVPDVAIVIQGHFRDRNSPRSYEYLLQIVDRQRGAYYAELSNNLGVILAELPSRP